MADLYVYYSFSGRTHRLIRQLVDRDPTAVVVRLETEEPLRPPVSTWCLCLWIIKAKKGWRVPIKPIDVPEREFDCLTIGSPTWSGGPAGPMLSFLDRDLPGIRFKQARYLISCRRSWEENARYLEGRVGQPMTGTVVPYVGNLLQSYVETWRDLCRRSSEEERNVRRIE